MRHGRMTCQHVDGARDRCVYIAVAGVGIDWTFAGDEDRSTLERIIAMLVALGGMLVTALMLGIVSDTIGEKMDELRQGKSHVLESGHVLILGWSDKLLPIVKQLAIAFKGDVGSGCVVILAERPKDEMDSDVSYYLEHMEGELADAAGAAHIICRQGNPVFSKDLVKVGPPTPGFRVSGSLLC